MLLPAGAGVAPGLRIRISISMEFDRKIKLARR